MCLCRSISWENGGDMLIITDAKTKKWPVRDSIKTYTLPDRLLPLDLDRRDMFAFSKWCCEIMSGRVSSLFTNSRPSAESHTLTVTTVTHRWGEQPKKNDGLVYIRTGCLTVYSLMYTISLNYFSRILSSLFTKYDNLCAYYLILSRLTIIESIR